MNLADTPPCLRPSAVILQDQRPHLENIHIEILTFSGAFLNPNKLLGKQIRTGERRAWYER